MTAKSVFRFLLGVAIAAGLLAFAAPYANIPQSHLLPPPIVYANARGKTQGVITRKRAHETGNPFRVGTTDYLLDYTFTARAPKSLGVPRPGTVTRYTGTVLVDQRLYQSVQAGVAVPVKYELTYPYISGIELPGAGRSRAPGSTLLSGWLIWAFAAVMIGYGLASFLERFWRGENF